MTPEALFTEYESVFPKRKFVAGLLVAFIDFLESMGTTDPPLTSFDEFLEHYPRQKTTAQGARANTLIVRLTDGGTRSIRPHYNRAENYFRNEHKRFDYPSCAPHATQAWSDYIQWLDALISCPSQVRMSIREKVIQHVLATLPSHELDLASVIIDPPLFSILVGEFDLKRHKNEPSGAALQGIVFGFLRADNPHLQMEVDKVRTGSRRLQRIGDVDGWDGGRLAVTAEVKQYVLSGSVAQDFTVFADSASKRGAIGIVFAIGFGDGVRAQLESLGLQALDLDDIQRVLALWDTIKQRIAITSLFYYIRHVEKNSALINRVEEFVNSATEVWNSKYLRSNSN